MAVAEPGSKNGGDDGGRDAENQYQAVSSGGLMNTATRRNLKPYGIGAEGVGALRARTGGWWRKSHLRRALGRSGKAKPAEKRFGLACEAERLIALY